MADTVVAREDKEYIQKQTVVEIDVDALRREREVALGRIAWMTARIAEIEGILTAAGLPLEKPVEKPIEGVIEEEKLWQTKQKLH